MTTPHSRLSAVFALFALTGTAALAFVAFDAARERSSIPDRMLLVAIYTLAPLTAFGIIGAFHQLRVGTAASWLQRSATRLVIYTLAVLVFPLLVFSGRRRSSLSAGAWSAVATVVTIQSVFRMVMHG